MKIAVPVHHGFVNEHFGHSEEYAVYSISEEKKIIHSELITVAQGCGCRSGIAEILSRQGVSKMLTGNIGAGAIRHMYDNGIEVIRGCSGLAEEVVMNYLHGDVEDNQQICDRHEQCN
jgi:predicted Fe-Mo cluster-binding NifX family protein